MNHSNTHVLYASLVLYTQYTGGIGKYDRLDNLILFLYRNFSHPRTYVCKSLQVPGYGYKCLDMDTSAWICLLVPVYTYMWLGAYLDTTKQACKCAWMEQKECLGVPYITLPSDIINNNGYRSA